MERNVFLFLNIAFNQDFVNFQIWGFNKRFLLDFLIALIFVSFIQRIVFLFIFYILNGENKILELSTKGTRIWDQYGTYMGPVWQ